MPIHHLYDDGLGLLATIASGIVTEVEMEESRRAAAEKCGSKPPRIILIDLTGLRDCPKMFERTVLSLMRMQLMYQSMGRIGQLVLRAEPESLGWGIGRMYLSQAPLMEWVEICLTGSDAELSAHLQAIATADLAPACEAALAEPPVARLLAAIESCRGG